MAPTETRTPGASDLTPAQYTDALEIPIPVPRLTPSFRLVCDLEAVRSVGEGLHGDGGQFNWINFTGGHFEGTWGHGEIVAGGQDAQHIMPRSHPSSPLAAQLSTRYLLRTSDGVFIQVQTRGWRTGPAHVLQRLSDAAREGFEGQVPGPDEYRFRLCVEMETDSRSDKYAWLNTAMWVGSGVRSGRQVIYDAYLIE
ncbi:outer membrane protein, beta-barrel domain containing protein [Rhodotorula toruloides]|uniref:Outer membrane protein, beta-barrel domain containing protein n=1 Tax=Rhodotorula toruloides TaxID=5286 RepID=A0A511KLJ1_RHOTO|nr:outer membrane protein, beta-barrel domain containing protein [Rhodotorula toruloides]